MTEEFEVKRALARLQQQHAEDYDGGYSKVEAIIQYAAEHPILRSSLAKVLVSAVVSRQPSLWAVALDVIAQASLTEAIPDLVRLVESIGEDVERLDYIIWTLLRLRVNRPNFRTLIENAIADKREGAWANLAAFAVVAPSEGLQITATLLATKLAKGQIDEVASVVPTLVLNYSKVDEDLLVQLLDRVKVLNISASDQLRHLMIHYINLPWNSYNLGRECQQRLVKNLGGSGTT